jgi:hypothetical protein
MASISSINIIALPACLASLNKVLTLAAHKPTNISINSDHDALKKATSASQATARASKVFQEPGSQYNNIHFGCLAQTL